MKKDRIWFEIDKTALGLGKVNFEMEIDSGINFMMTDIFKTLGNGDGENGGKGSLWKCAPEIYETLCNYDAYEYAGCSWRVLPMTHEQFRKAKEWTLEEYKANVKGWISRDCAVSLDELRVDRYCLYFDKPFQFVHKKYLDEYEKADENGKVCFGTFLEWMEGWPTLEELNEGLKG